MQMQMKMPFEEVCWIRRGNSDYYSLLQNIIPSFAGRNAMAKLEARIRELETELGNAQAMILSLKDVTSSISFL